MIYRTARETWTITFERDGVTINRSAQPFGEQGGSTWVPRLQWERARRPFRRIYSGPMSRALITILAADAIWRGEV